MFKFLQISIISIMSMVVLSGCNVQQPKLAGTNNYVNPTSLDDAIDNIANELRIGTTINFKSDKGTIAVTSFVDLNQLNKTTQFGRILGESMISELFKRGFNVSEFRGQGAISVNKHGEFYITRELRKLSMEVPNTYILVGTYAQIEDKTLLNVRIIDNKTGKIIASAREIYDQDYCVLSQNCGKKRIIKIVTDQASRMNCITTFCPTVRPAIIR